MPLVDAQSFDSSANLNCLLGVWSVDVTAPLMILALKLFAFAQNYSDGQYQKLGMVCILPLLLIISESVCLETSRKGSS